MHTAIFKKGTRRGALVILADKPVDEAGRALLYLEGHSSAIVAGLAAQIIKTPAFRNMMLEALEIAEGQLTNQN